ILADGEAEGARRPVYAKRGHHGAGNECSRAGVALQQLAGEAVADFIGEIAVLDEIGIEGDASAFEGFAVSFVTVKREGEAVAAIDHGDAPMAEIEQMGSRAIDRPFIV